MKKLLVIILSIACLLAIVSCDEAHPQNIEKEDMSMALGKVSESLDSKDFAKPTILPEADDFKPIAKAAVDALKLILDCTQEAEVNLCAGYEQSATASVGDNLAFFGTSGKVKFEYKNGVIVAAISNCTTVIASTVENFAYVKVDFDFAREKVNSFTAAYMMYGTVLKGVAVFSIDENGTSSANIYYDGLTPSQELADFRRDIYSAIKDEQTTTTIDISRVVARLKAEDIPTSEEDFNKALQDVHNFLSAKGTKSGTVSGTFGSVTRAYKYDGNGVLAITDGANDIAYVEVANNVTTYYYKDGQTWYKKTSKPASIDLQETIKTAIGALVTVGDAVFGYDFDESTATNAEFKYELTIFSDVYSFAINFNPNQNVKAITSINLVKNDTTIANLTVSGINSTTIPNFATNKANAVVAN